MSPCVNPRAVGLLLWKLVYVVGWGKKPKNHKIKPSYFSLLSKTEVHHFSIL